MGTRLRMVAALALLAPCGACAGSSGPAEMPDPDVAPHPTSPAGDAYPTANVGHAPGQVIPNLAFQGYVDSNRAAGLKTVSLSDLYDRTGSDHVLLYVTVSGTWCAACAAAAGDMTRLGPKYRAQGVVMLEIVVAGPSPGFGPAESDLDGWITREATTWTVVADVRGRRVDGQLDLLGVPSSMLVDTRTMEIIHEAAGAPDDLAAYFQLGLDWISKHPAP